MIAPYIAEKIDPEEYAIIPGMSVVPKVKIREN